MKSSLLGTKTDSALAANQKDGQKQSKENSFDLEITGMTCSACVSRVEKKLAKAGAQAQVNLVTGRARVNSENLGANEIIAVVEKAGYNAKILANDALPSFSSANEAVESWRNRFFIVAPLATVVMALSMVSPWQFVGWQWVVAALTLPIITWGAWPFYRGFWMAARSFSTTMDTLVALGLAAISIFSYAVLFFAGGGRLGLVMDMNPLTIFSSQALSSHLHGQTGQLHMYFEAAAMLVTFLLAGNWASSRAKHRSGQMLRDLSAEENSEIQVLCEFNEKMSAQDILAAPTRKCLVRDIALGEVFLVRVGQQVATDGQVVAGSGEVDNSWVSGESLPLAVAPGSELNASVVLLDGFIAVRATKVGLDTLRARVVNAIVEAQMTKAPVQEMADRVAGVFVPVVLAIAATTFIFWWIFGPSLSVAVVNAVAVLVVACPCALGLATPTALLVALTRAGRYGILIKNPQALEQMAKVDAVVFDKTGTLTKNELVVEQIQVFSSANSEKTKTEENENFALLQALALEASSNHPLAHALRREAEKRGLAADKVAQNILTIPGSGVSAEILGARLYFGKPQWALSHLPAQGPVLEVKEFLANFADKGVSLSVLVKDTQPVAAFVLRDQPRKHATLTVKRLEERSIPAYLLTGDTLGSAQSIAQELGISSNRVFAQVDPLEKVEKIEFLQAQGKRVAMVGEGINDGAALARAAVSGAGIAMGSGSELAKSTAQVVILNSDPREVARALLIASRTSRVIRQNLFWAFGYNLVAICCAAFGVLSPVVAGAAMAFSSFFVVSNSLRLSRKVPV